LALSQGDVTTFITRPISATLLAISAVMTVAVSFKIVRMKRKMVEEEEN